MTSQHIQHISLHRTAVSALLFLCVSLLLLVNVNCGQGSNNATFRNSTEASVDAYYVDESGAESHMGTLEPGDTWGKEVQDGDVWLFKQNGQVVGRYRMGSASQQSYIVSLPGEGTAGSSPDPGNARSLDRDHTVSTPVRSNAGSFVTQKEPLNSSDFEPDMRDPAIQYRDDGFVLPPYGVSMWSKEEVYDLDQSQEFTLEFDALLQTNQQEIIVAFSQTMAPYGADEADALTVRTSPRDQYIWIRTKFYDVELATTFDYEEEEEVFVANKEQHYAIQLNATTITVFVDGRRMATTELEEEIFPRRGYLGFIVYGNPDIDAPISYRNIAMTRVSEEAPVLAMADNPPPGEPETTRDFAPPTTPTNPATPTLAAAGQYHALIIGVQNYINDSIKDLDFPVQDARNIVATLTNQYTFEQDNVTFLEDPTKSDIMNALDVLVDRVKPEDNLLVFYAGHGYWDKRMNQGFWLPADAEQGKRANWLSNSTIRDYVTAIQNQHTLIISDACFSGGLFKTRAAFTGADRATEELYRLPSRKAMTSGALTEVPDKSAFVRFFLDRLQSNEAAYLTAQRLFNSLREPVINNSPLEQIPQFGVIQSTGDEGGEFVFRRKQ